MMYQTQVTAYVQEPKVAEVAPPISYGDFDKEYEKEQALIRKKMAKDTVMVRTFVEDEVCLLLILYTDKLFKIFFNFTSASHFFTLFDTRNSTNAIAFLYRNSTFLLLKNDLSRKLNSELLRPP